MIGEQKQQPISKANLVLQNKILSVTEGLPLFFERLLTEKTSKENALIIADYILALKTEINLSLNYRRMNIQVLINLCKFLNHKDLRKANREEITSFLDNLRKPEASDSLHKWIGTYNLYRVLLIRFFRWLYYPDIEHKKRLKPPVVQNIPELKRKEQSIYKPSDLWSADDDLLFLKYCPNVRDRCYHAISRDLSCRPSEILNLRLKDVTFKTSGNSQYAEVLVNGKTGTRYIPLISSIPYLKDFLDAHPQRGNSNAFLIPTMSDRSYCRRMTSHSMNTVYKRYRDAYLPRLLDDLSVPPEDKHRIRQLLKKPFCPYLRRHIGLTEKSKILKEHILKQYSGWSGRSQMHLKYLHYFGNESSESILEAYGLKPKAEEIDKLKPKQCPNCNESCKVDAKFCPKCRMILSYDAYAETMEEKNQKEGELEEMKSMITKMGTQIDNFMSSVKNMDDSTKQKIAENMISKGIYVQKA